MPASEFAPERAPELAPADPTRRTALAALGLGAAAATTAGLTGVAGAAVAAGASTAGAPGFAVLSPAEAGWNAATQRYELPALPYAHDALEPAIDAETMRIHHGKHHAGYIRGMQRALDKLEAIRAGEGDAALVKHWSRELSFHSAGHFNHALFWRVMAPAGQGGGGRPAGPIASMIDRDFGSFDAFRVHFIAASAAVEGSGWGWLVLDPVADRLMIIQGEKQQNLMTTGAVPLLGLDVWEHAYYLRYQNRRREYVENFFDVINWAQVDSMLGRMRPTD
ncbi:MAG: superoxide dismutase [Phycisphaerales bacterium]